MTKVPYTMRTVRRRKGSSGYTVAGTFSGCGGSSLGYTLAGFETVWANEFDSHAADCYEANLGKVVDRRSITEITAGDIPPVDVLEGSPPCSKFSTAGKREKSWGKVTASDQSEHRLANVEDLFFEWTRLLGELRPRAAVAENVVGLTIGVAKGYLLDIVETIRGLGYGCEVWKLNASSYGVAQTRRRIFVVAHDPERCARPVVPARRKKWVTAREATADLDTFVTRFETDKQVVPQNWAPTIEGFKIDRYAKGLRPGQKHDERFTLGMAHPDRPYPTLQSMETGSRGLASTLHWDTDPKRKLSVEEAMRYASFPDDYRWPDGSTWHQIGVRLGNVVPPLLAEAVASSVRTALETHDA